MRRCEKVGCSLAAQNWVCSKCGQWIMIGEPVHTYLDLTKVLKNYHCSCAPV